MKVEEFEIHGRIFEGQDSSSSLFYKIREIVKCLSLNNVNSKVEGENAREKREPFCISVLCK